LKLVVVMVKSMTPTFTFLQVMEPGALPSEPTVAQRLWFWRLAGNNVVLLLLFRNEIVNRILSAPNDKKYDV
jgi:hypothetical protein